jgi:hypothetical protein
VYRNTPECDLYLDPEKTTYIGGFFELMGSHTYGRMQGYPLSELL